MLSDACSYKMILLLVVVATVVILVMMVMSMMMMIMMEMINGDESSKMIQAAKPNWGKPLLITTRRSM